ncbi:MAG TPA: LysR substrate-binding domain-containing protein [Chloroflexota bacterium]|nr:LysR substrate-binding domain-containing protein [Chloroflexota bacterium]
MEINQLVYFEAVARHLHFTRAAEELHVAQPSVSQQIQKLEETLGIPLFHRMKRRVTLTEAGREFLPRVRSILQQIEEARAAVQEVTELRRGALAVGAPPSVGTYLFPNVLAAFNEHYPGITLVFREGGSRVLVERLEAGELDLAVVIEPVRHPVLEAVPLLEEELVLAVPVGHRLAGRGVVRLAELQDEPFVMLRAGVYELREQTLDACRAVGFTPIIALDGCEMDTALRFVAAGIGVSLLPAPMVTSSSGIAGRAGSAVTEESRSTLGAVAVRVVEPVLKRSLVIARRKDRYYSSAAREFSGLLRKHAGAVQAVEIPAANQPEATAGDAGVTRFQRVGALERLVVGE